MDRELFKNAAQEEKYPGDAQKKDGQQGQRGCAEGKFKDATQKRKADQKTGRCAAPDQAAVFCRGTAHLQQHRKSRNGQRDGGQAAQLSVGQKAAEKQLQGKDTQDIGQTAGQRFSQDPGQETPLDLPEIRLQGQKEGGEADV